MHIALLRYTKIMQCQQETSRLRGRNRNSVARGERHRGDRETQRTTTKMLLWHHALQMPYKRVHIVRSLTHNAPGRWLRPKSLATCPAKSLIVRTLSGTWTIHLAAASDGSIQRKHVEKLLGPGNCVHPKSTNSQYPWHEITCNILQ